jgi:putative oligomerization/nucleic acid binding protein
VGYSPTAVTYGEEEDMSFRDRARRKLQERAQTAQSGDDQGQPGDQPEAQPAASTPAQPEAQPAASTPAQPDYTAELEQLARLKEQGILTEEEFTAKKKQILGI